MPPKTTAPATTVVPGARTIAHAEGFLDSLLNDTPLVYVQGFARVLLTRLIILLALLLLFFIVRWIVHRVVARAMSMAATREEGIGRIGQAAHLRTLSGLVQSSITYVIAIWFVIAGLGALGVNVLGLLGTAGVAGLAVGFGAQKLVKDVISGFFLLLEDQYAVGDYVTIGAVTGTVEEIGMRITRVRDDDGKLYILSNGDISQVCNQSRGPVGGSFEVGIATSADIAKARAVLDDALHKESDTLGLAEAARVDGVTGLEAAKTTLRVRFRTYNTMRPSEAAWRLREAAHDALVTAQIPLG